MAINERLIHTAADAAAAGTGNQEEGLILHLDANDVDSYDGDGDIWYDITNHEYTPAVDPSENFNTATFIGNGSTNSITGVGFQPDLVWLKHRSGGSPAATNHYLYDSVRGNTKVIFPNLTLAEVSVSNHITSFDVDGFTLGNDTAANANNANYVAWCFKAGGVPSGADKVSIDGTSHATMTDAGLTDGTVAINKLSVNTQLGFSIATYNGNNSTGSVAHGLGQKPELIIIKNIDSNNTSWIVFHDAIPATQYLQFTTAAATTASNRFNDTEPTSTVWSFGTSDNVHTASEHVVYSFASKRGVSKVGSYTGTGAAGNKVYTGFQPAWIMFKRTNSTSDWNIVDNQTSTSGFNKYLRPNSNAVEATPSTTINIEADGFSFNGSSFNSSGGNWIYLAFAAEKPDSLTPDRASFTEGSVTTGAELELDANDYSGSGNWLDSSGNSNDGTISGATYVNDGNSDYFDFDGSNDYVDFGDLAGFGTELSLEVWVNPDGTQNQYSTIIDFEHSNDEGWVIYQDINNLNQYKFAVKDGSSWDTSSSISLTSGVWSHLLFTVDSSGGMKSYLNGELQQTLTSFDGLGTTARRLNLGCWGSDGGVTRSRFWNGQIGQVRIYSSAFTPQQVQTNYDATKGLYTYPNLALHLDPTSYSGSGTTWTADVGNDATVVASRYNQELGDSFDVSTDSEATIVIPSGHPLNDNNFTLEFWFRSTEDWNNSGKGHWFIYEGSAAGWNFFYYEGLGWRLSVPVSTGYFGNGTVITNKWHHVSLTYTGGTTKFYLDGELLKTHSATRSSSSLGSFDFGSTYSAAYKPKCDIGQIRMYSSAITADEVMQNYRFTKNDYPNGIHFTGNNISSADWNSNGYFDLDGSTEYFETSGNPSALINATDFTVSAWVWRTSGVTSYTAAIGQSNALGNIQNWLLAVSGSGDLYFNIYGIDDYTSVSGVISYETWTHIAGVVEADGTKRMYKNGVLQGSSSSGKSADTTSYNTFVGSYGTSSKWNGRIGAVKYYNKALTASELLADYNATKSTYGL